MKISMIVAGPRGLLLAVFAVHGAACGENTSPNDGMAGASASSAPLLPWQSGNTWTYQVTDADGVSMKVTTVGNEEMVGGSGPHAGKLALKVVTAKGGSDMTISWQARLDDRVVRYREQAFHANSGELELEEHWDPYKVHADDTEEHRLAGATWLEEYRETKRKPSGIEQTATERDRWTVQAENETVTVPAGTFRALVVRKAGGTTEKTYWFAPGIGKLKETGGQTEELVSYDVDP